MAAEKRAQKNVLTEPNKRQRLGVGTSVANLVRSPVDDLILVMAKIKAEQLRPKGLDVKTINRLDSLPTLAQRLMDYNVLSLPVINREAKFFGFVDQRDLVMFISNMFSDLEATQLVDIQRVFESEDNFRNSVVADVMIYPVRKRNPYNPVTQGLSLYSAWEIIVNEGLHRLPIVDSDGNIVDIITQSMLIDFLWQNIEKIGDLSQKEVKDIPTSHQNVFSINQNSRAIIGFRHMVAMGVYGLAVVDNNGKLVDNLSLRDLKRVHANSTMFWRLWNSIKDFKQTMRAEAPPTTATRQTEDKPLCVTASDTLYTVVEKMALSHVHRLYEVKDTNSMIPTRVISQSDILAYIIQSV